MEKAKQNEFSKMTIEEARKLPLDGKVVDGKPTSLTLKRGLVKDDGREYVERRVFKNADMTDVCVYDLPLPLTLASAKTMYGESGCLDAIWTAQRIKTDSTKAGKGGADPEKKAEKALSVLSAMGVSQEDIAKMKAEIKKHGFGK